MVSQYFLKAMAWLWEDYLNCAAFLIVIGLSVVAVLPVMYFFPDAPKDLAISLPTIALIGYPAITAVGTIACLYLYLAALIIEGMVKLSLMAARKALA